jgi:peptide/nickel transport system permease protein
VRAYLLKRLLLIPFTLFGITFITFGIMQVAPGDPSQMLRAQMGSGNMQASQSNKEAIENWRKERHLDKHWTIQYGYWLRDLVTFDLGRSLMSGRERVSKLIGERLGVTLTLSLIAFIGIYVIAIPVGILCAAKQFTLTDRLLTIVVFLLYSLPSFWVGTILIAYCTGTLFKTTGYYTGTLAQEGLWIWLKENFKYMFLPVVCMMYAGFAFLSRQMRSALLEQIRQDFVRTARAKGLSERVVVLRHATRNALIPIVTLIGALLPALLGGNIIIEQMFSIPGMGQLFFTSISERDYMTVMGIEVVAALLTLGGMLLSDILYVVVNPAIAYD